MNFFFKKKFQCSNHFVVGLHRSGATYVSQVLLRKLNIYGLNNINNIFNKSPIIITKLLRNLLINIKDYGL